MLEGLFFRRHGLRSISLSYAQQASTRQDEEAVTALQAIAADLLPAGDRHVVIYTYMGVYPLAPGGSLHFAARKRHRVSNGGDGPVELITVSTRPLFDDSSAEFASATTEIRQSKPAEPRVSRRAPTPRRDVRDAAAARPSKVDAADKKGSAKPRAAAGKRPAAATPARRKKP